MSRIVPQPEREKVEAAPRRRRSPAQREAIWAAHRGICAVCGLTVGVTEMELDHERGLFRGGDDSDANLRPLHPACHKTKDDPTVNAEIRRHAKMRLDVPREPSKHPIRSAPMPKWRGKWPTRKMGKRK